MTFEEFEIKWNRAVETDLANIRYGVVHHDRDRIFHKCALRGFLRSIIADHSWLCRDWCPYNRFQSSFCYKVLDGLIEMFDNNEHIVKQFVMYFRIEKKLRAYKCKDLYYRYESYIDKLPEEL